jgi:long-chain acyl-CoA synthetase
LIVLYSEPFDPDPSEGWRDMNLVQAIGESLQQQPGKIIARDAEASLTAEALLRAAHSAADRSASTAARMVGLLLPNCALYPPAFLGVLWAGKVPVLLNPLLKPAELDFVFRETGIDTVIVSEVTRPLVAGLPLRALPVGEMLASAPPEGPRMVAADAEAVAVLLYTSGTTGRPKGVPLTHRNLLSNAQSMIRRLRGSSEDRILAVLPLFHAFGLTGQLIGPLLVGAEVIYARFAPDRVAAQMAEWGVSVFIAVPSMYRLLIRRKVPAGPLRQLRLAISGGDALPASVRDAYRERFGRELLEGYGLTETSPVVSVNTPEENRPGTVGRVLPGVEVRIQGPDGAAVAAGEQGEIQVRGPNVMRGYYNRPEEDRVAFTPDGWFRTGDLGALDADQYLTVSGRIKELIVRDGEKIMPREVEEVLERHPKVFDVAVLGEPDGPCGEAVVAYVTPAEEVPTAQELRDFCRARLADFKIPRRFVIARDLPRGPTGKILKRALNDWQPAEANPRPPEAGLRPLPPSD